MSNSHLGSSGSRPQFRGKSSSTRRINAFVRVPKDYPWVIAGHLINDLVPLADPFDLRKYYSCIRSRNLEELYRIADEWSLQSSNSIDQTVPLHTVKIRLLMGQFLKKFPFEGDEETRRQAAIDKFEAAEVQCSQFNTEGWKSLVNSDGSYHRFIRDAQYFCRQILGERVPSSVTEWSRHGPGSSTGTVRGKVSKYDKYLGYPYHCTSDAAGLAARLILSDERWWTSLDADLRTQGYDLYGQPDSTEFRSRLLYPVLGNRITTVPKDGRTDRPIAIEPTMNLMLQLGVDGFIRKRLKRWGINLDSQRKNQVLAHNGSLDTSQDSPVTIDLASASDTVSLRICKMLLPEQWYQYVCAIRSPKGILPNGRVLRYSKISSMGNGATFAIETLIFAAIAFAVSKATYGQWERDKIAIYGDDIVVPKLMARHLLRRLEQCGFSINVGKSFLDGPARESCGCDRFLGRNVRPVYCKVYPKTVCDLYSMRNTIHRWFRRHLDSDIPNLDKLFQKWIPEDLFFSGPYSDQEFSGHWHSDVIPPYKGSVHQFVSVVFVPHKIRADNFFIGKLMHDLRDRKQPVRPWEGGCSLSKQLEKEYPSASSVFNRTIRGAGYFRKVFRTTSIWSTEYSPVDTID